MGAFLRRNHPIGALTAERSAGQGRPRPFRWRRAARTTPNRDRVSLEAIGRASHRPRSHLTSRSDTIDVHLSVRSDTNWPIACRARRTSPGRPPGHRGPKGNPGGGKGREGRGPQGRRQPRPSAHTSLIALPGVRRGRATQGVPDPHFDGVPADAIVTVSVVTSAPVASSRTTGRNASTACSSSITSTTSGSPRARSGKRAARRWRVAPNPSMPRHTVAPAIPRSWARSTTRSATPRWSMRSSSETKMRSRVAGLPPDTSPPSLLQRPCTPGCFRRQGKGPSDRASVRLGADMERSPGPARGRACSPAARWDRLRWLSGISLVRLRPAMRAAGAPS